MDSLRRFSGSNIIKIEKEMKQSKLTHGSLFSGIGGFELGAEMAGIDTLWNCEIEKFQGEILKNKFPHAERYTDITKTPDSDMWTSLVEDFRVKTSALPESVKVLKGNDPAYGVRCIELYGRLDLSTSSLKIRQLSLFPVSNKSYAIFPKAGMMRNGNVYQTTLLDTRTKGKDFTLLPTPTKSDYKATYANVEALTRYLNSGHQIRVSDILVQKGFLKSQRIALLEMMMGFPIGHTELGVSAMR